MWSEHRSRDRDLFGHLGCNPWTWTVRRRISRTKRTRGPSVPHCPVRHDGEYRWVSDEGVARHDAQGNFVGYVSSCVDVTELINKDEALRKSEERMRLAADAVHLGIWEWDLGKDEAWVTNARRAFWGWPASGKITLEHFISRVHPDDRNRIRQAIDDAIHKGKDYDSEYRIILPDGSVHWMSTRAT